MKQGFIAIAGNIGAGKTSLAENLGSQLNCGVGRETVSENKYLSDFYADPARWFFHLAVYNLETRIRQHYHWLAENKLLVTDRTIYEDRYIFVETQWQSGIMSKRDYDCYLSLWDMLQDKITAPDLVLYIETPLFSIESRVKTRARDIESSVSLEYLTVLDQAYKSWIQTFDVCPVHHIDGSQTEADVTLQALSMLGHAP